MLELGFVEHALKVANSSKTQPLDDETQSNMKHPVDALVMLLTEGQSTLVLYTTLLNRHTFMSCGTMVHYFSSCQITVCNRCSVEVMELLWTNVFLGCHWTALTYKFLVPWQLATLPEQVHLYEWAMSLLLQLFPLSKRQHPWNIWKCLGFLVFCVIQMLLTHQQPKIRYTWATCYMYLLTVFLWEGPFMLVYIISCAYTLTGLRWESFLPTDANCTKLVEMGVHKELMKLLKSVANMEVTMALLNKNIVMY